MQSNEEIWKDIPEYKGYYQVSNLGRIKSLKRPGVIEDRVLKLPLNTHGYPIFIPSANKKKRETLQVHRIVAMAFIPNHGNNPCVNHINGNKTDNYVGNLEWCTYSENNYHAFRTGLKQGTRGENNPWSKLNEEDIHLIRELHNSGLSAYRISKQFTVHDKTISNIINGTKWKHIPVRGTMTKTVTSETTK